MTGARAGIYEWRGKRYVGARAVAEAAGVTRSAVSYHLRKNGNLDNLGARAAWSVEIDGRRFASPAELAEAAGVNNGTAALWAREGRHDLIRAALNRRESDD